MTKSETARSLFLQGYNCAQSVVGAFAPEMGMSLEQAVGLASALGGGVGRLRLTCGAVTGMAVVYGALRGYSQPGTHGEKTRTYAAMQRLGQAFCERAGSYSCRELLGEQAGRQITPQAQARTAEYYQSRPCPELVALAAGLLEEELARPVQTEP